MIYHITIVTDLLTAGSMPQERTYMARNDNPNARRFMESMEKHGESKEAEKFSSVCSLSRTASAEKRFRWAKELCDFLDRNYDDEKIREIRMDCACGPTKGMIERLIPLYQKEDPVLFVEKVNALDLGYSLEYDGTSYFLIYPECYCSCVKASDDLLSRTWCYCTLGYTKKWFEAVFGKEVSVELLEAVKCGDSRCRIRITEK